MTDEFKAIAQTWAKHGIELRVVVGNRYYLIKRFADATFVIRHASDTLRLPQPSDCFRVWLHDRVTCQLSQDVQRVVGIDQLEIEISNWRQRIKRTVAPKQPQKRQMNSWGFPSSPLPTQRVANCAL